MNRETFITVSKGRWDNITTNLYNHETQLKKLIEANQDKIIIVDKSIYSLPIIESFPDSEEFKNYIIENKLATIDDLSTHKTAEYWKDKCEKTEFELKTWQNEKRRFHSLVHNYNQSPWWKKIFRFKI